MDPGPGASNSQNPRVFNQYSDQLVLLPPPHRSQVLSPQGTYFPSRQSYPSNLGHNGFHPSSIVKPEMQQQQYNNMLHQSSSNYPNNQQYAPLPVVYRYDKVPNDRDRYKLNGSLAAANLCLASTNDNNMLLQNELTSASNNFLHPCSNSIYDVEKYINGPGPRTNHNHGIHGQILGTGNLTETTFSNSHSENTGALNLSKPQESFEQPASSFIQDPIAHGQSAQFHFNPYPHTQSSSVIMHTTEVTRQTPVENQMSPENDDNDDQCAFILSGPSSVNKGRRQSHIYNGDERIEYSQLNEPGEIDLPPGQFQEQFNSIMNDIGSNQSFAYARNFIDSAATAPRFWNGGTENQVMPSQNQETFVPSTTGQSYTPGGGDQVYETVPNQHFENMEDYVETKYMSQETLSTSVPYYTQEQSSPLVAVDTHFVGRKPRRGSSRPRSGAGRGRGKQQVAVSETAALENGLGNFSELQYLPQIASLNVTPKQRGRPKLIKTPIVESTGAESEAGSVPPGSKPEKPKKAPAIRKRAPKKDNISSDAGIDFNADDDNISSKPKRKRTPKAKQNQEEIVYGETSQMDTKNSNSVNSDAVRMSPDITDYVREAPLSRGRGRGRGRGKSLLPEFQKTQISKRAKQVNLPRGNVSIESIALAAISPSSIEETGHCSKMLDQSLGTQHTQMAGDVHPAQYLEGNQSAPGIEMISNIATLRPQFNTPSVFSNATLCDDLRNQSMENRAENAAIDGPYHAESFFVRNNDNDISQNDQPDTFITTSIADLQENPVAVVRQPDMNYMDGCDVKFAPNKLSIPHHKSRGYRGKRNHSGGSRQSTLSEPNDGNEEAKEDDKVEPRRKTRIKTSIRKKVERSSDVSISGSTEEDENLNVVNEEHELKHDPEYKPEEEDFLKNANPIDQDGQLITDQKVENDVTKEEQSSDNHLSVNDVDDNETNPAKMRQNDSTSGQPKVNRKVNLLKRPVNRSLKNLKKPKIPMRESFTSNIESKLGKRGKGKMTFEREEAVIAIKTEVLSDQTTQSHGVVAPIAPPSKFAVPLYSEEEKKILYGNGRFVININDIDKNPDQIFIWEILEAERCLRQYYPSKYCEMQFFISSPVKYYFYEEEFKSDLFYTQFQPIVTIIANEKETCTPDMKKPFLAVAEKTVQYVHVDRQFFCRMARCIGKIDKTEHLREDFMKSLPVFTMLTLRPTFLKTFLPLLDSGSADSMNIVDRYRTMLVSWANIGYIIAKVVNQAKTSSRFTPETFKRLLQFPSLHYTQNGVDKNVFCSACSPKSRVPIVKVSFISKQNVQRPYNLDTLEEYEEGAAPTLPDQDIYWCRACSTRARRLHGLMHFRYKLLRITKQNIVKDLEIFSKSNIGPNETAVLWAQENAINWKNKMFLDFQMSIAEIEQEFVSLKEETETSSQSV